MFSKVKGSLRSVAARTTEAASGATVNALRAVRQSDIVGEFGSCDLGVTERLQSVVPSRSTDRRRADDDRGVKP